MRTSADFRREDGSLLLALLAVLIIGGLVTVLLASTVTGQRQVQFDRNFSNAIHPADSGIQAAITYINTEEASDGTRPATGDVFSDTGEVSDGHRFTWEAKKVNDLRWEVFAYGEAPDGTVRLLEAEIVPQSLFKFAAFAKTKFGTNGDNSADSYDPDPDDDGRAGDGIAFDAPPEPGGTGNGIIGSNGVIQFSGASTADQVDGVELHNFQDDPLTPEDEEDVDYRVQGDCNGCDVFRQLVENGGKLYGLFEKPLTFDTWWIAQTLSAGEDRNPSSPYSETGEECNSALAPSDAVPPIPASDQGTLPDRLDFLPSEVRITYGGTTHTWPTPNGLPGGVWCAGSDGVHFTPNNGDIDLRPADIPDRPAIVYTSGPITAQGGMHINCREPSYTCEGDKHPFSTNLQIYSVGSQLTLRQQTHIAALLYAPNAVCDGGADVNIYGSLVCDRTDNVGTWDFHFDENARKIKKQEYHLQTWREEPGGATFDWVTISPR